MLSLICSHKHKSQLAGLQVLGSLAFMSDKAAEKLLTPRLQAALEVGAWVAWSPAAPMSGCSPEPSGSALKLPVVTRCAGAPSPQLAALQGQEGAHPCAL